MPRRGFEVALLGTWAYRAVAFAQAWCVCPLVAVPMSVSSVHATRGEGSTTRLTPRTATLRTLRAMRGYGRHRLNCAGIQVTVSAELPLWDATLLAGSVPGAPGVGEGGPPAQRHGAGQLCRGINYSRPRLLPSGTPPCLQGACPVQPGWGGARPASPAHGQARPRGPGQASGPYRGVGAEA